MIIGLSIMNVLACEAHLAKALVLVRHTAAAAEGVVDVDGPHLQYQVHCGFPLRRHQGVHLLALALALAWCPGARAQAHPPLHLLRQQLGRQHLDGMMLACLRGAVQEQAQHQRALSSSVGSQHHQ